MMINLILKNTYMPMPSNISYWWNFGSLLGFCLISQIITGIFLSMFYENNPTSAFDSISQISRNINLGWLTRSLHANGASLFFIFIYLHIGRGLFYKSFSLKYVWKSGVMILLLLFMTAFIGYVLPWGQMSFWGATVITNLLSSIPYAGTMMTLWLWGNFTVSKATLMRFFSLHFLLPFIILFLVLIHLMLLHIKGSNNPLGYSSNIDKIPFQPFFVWKDFFGIFFSLCFFLTFCFIFPYLLMDPDNFMPANPLSTPPHIQPEWYFLFAYAILRSIPNKLGGVLALLSSILILLMLSFLNPMKMNLMNMKMLYKIMFTFWLTNFIYLTSMGAMPIEEPYILTSTVSSLAYFLFYSIYI